MQRARRLNSIPPYLFGEVARMKAKVIAEGRDIVDLGIGDPDQPTPQPIIDKLREYAAKPETHRYDESDAGAPAFIDAVGRWYSRRFGVELDTDSEILLLIGSKEGLAHLAWAMIDPGDLSLIPDPAYTVYKVNTLMAGGEVAIMPLLAENKFLPDLTAIPSDAALRAKLMYINYPNNPTGAVATPEFFANVVDFAKHYDIAVCHDCAYSEVSFDGYRAPSFMQTPGAKDVGVEIHSLSKTFNMTGWRIGFAVGNPDIIAALRSLKSYIDSKQFAAISLSGAYALDHLNNDAALELIRRRRNILVDGLNSLGWRLEKPKATFYLWVPVPPGYSSVEFVKALLQDAGVLAIPGTGYGTYGEGYVRMSLTVSGDVNGERVAEAVRRIRDNVNISWG
ncbi:MAG: LL-diaminopimelate aminotransferase [Armatimonadota bacterium]|nr:LL-diaminopimelate aminotransferase [Armatimonadota bacterium]